ncbi:YraN family protein [Granulosicoccus sp. 3-233]|uniref:YraN family protein n=1 Tax=Granulosicoccus sp. 3-233 TaxID=3417969 RepID=UPI003D325126
MQTRDQGNIAENLARSWLQHHGYRFIEANYHRRVGEIDLIMQHPDERTVVFVEVRFRSRQQFGGALESVDFRKQRKLRRTANAWLQQHADDMTPARIDVLALSPADENTPLQQCWHSHQVLWVINAVEE